VVAATGGIALLYLVSFVLGFFGVSVPLIHSSGTFGILFSVFVTKCRRNRRERNALDHLSSDPCAWTSQDAAAEMSELSPSLKRALDELPKSFRDAVVLVDLSELSYKDAARRLGVPVGTVMSRLYRGRRLLAEAVRSGGTCETFPTEELSDETPAVAA